MRHPIDIRRQLHKQPTEFDWPLATKPRKDGVYKLQGEGAEWTFVVIDLEPTQKGWRVCARLHPEPHRLLPIGIGSTEREGEGAYEEQPIRVLRDGPVPEPEAVDYTTQQRFSKEGRMRDQAAIGDLVDAMGEVRASLESRVKNNPALRREVGPEIAQIRSRIDRAERKLKTRGTEADDAAA